MDNMFHVIQVAGGVAVALPAFISALIVLLKAIPGEQGETFLEEKAKPRLDKVLHLYGLVTKKNE